MFQKKEVIVLSRKNKWFMYTLCVFIILSIYKDFTRVEENSVHPPAEQLDKTYAVQRTVQRGDTMLSIMEDIHGDTEFFLHTDEVLNDFKAINNGADPFELTTHQSYYFPLYMH